MEHRTGRVGLKRHMCQRLRQVLQLKLRERRSREELLRRGTMPPVRTSAVTFNEQKCNLEGSRTDDYSSRKAGSGSERSDLIRILQETAVDPSHQVAQLQLKRARLETELNKQVSHRPAPIFRHILPLPSRIQPDIKEMQLSKVSDESCDDDSSCSMSPGMSINAESPLGLLSLPSPPQCPADSSAAPPEKVSPPSVPVPFLKLTNENVAQSVQTAGFLSQIQLKAKKKKPKVKKLKYHQYVHPDQKRDKELSAHLNPSSGRPFQQQQLLLQLQTLKHQQHQNHHYPPILPTLAKPQTGYDSSSCPHPPPSPSVPRPAVAPSLGPPSQIWRSSAQLGLRKPGRPLQNLDDMRVVELKSELKRRGLTVSGPKNELIERLRSYQEVNTGSGNTSSVTAGGTTGSGAERGGFTTIDSSPAEPPHQILHHQASLNLQPAAGQLPALLYSNVSPRARSTSPCARNPEDTNVNILEDVDCQVCVANQPQINTKEELRPFTLTPRQFSLGERKLCQVSLPCLTSSTAPRVTVDKDKMLQEKDRQIKELTRKLMQKEQLVEMLRLQLEIRTNGLPELMAHVKVKQEPPDSGPPSLIHPPSPPFTPTDETVTIKQEAIKKEGVLFQASPGLPQCTQRVHTCWFSQQQAMQKLLRPQQCNVQKEERTPQNSAPMLENLQNHSKQRKKDCHRQQLEHEIPDLTGQQRTRTHLEQQQTPQGNQIRLDQREALKSKPTPTLATNANDFPIEMSGHHSADDMQEYDAADRITLQAAEHKGDFIEVILQSGELAASKPVTDPIDYLNQVPPGSAPPSSPLQLALSPVTSPYLCLTPSRSECQTRVNAEEEQQCSGGHLEDCLESTAEETLLGAEPDGLLSLIDDLHGQMCASSVLEHPLSPREASSPATEEEHDLDLTIGGVICEDTSTLGPLVPQLPSSVFSTDFLDSFDLQMLTV